MAAAANHIAENGGGITVDLAVNASRREAQIAGSSSGARLLTNRNLKMQR